MSDLIQFNAQTQLCHCVSCACLINGLLNNGALGEKQIKSMVRNMKINPTQKGGNWKVKDATTLKILNLQFSCTNNLKSDS